MLGTLDPNEQIELVTEIVERLEQATKPPGNKSLLPNDLEASVEIVTAIITILEHNNSTNEVTVAIPVIISRVNLTVALIVYSGCDRDF